MYFDMNIKENIQIFVEEKLINLNIRQSDVTRSFL